MANAICSLCERPAKAHGWCAKHYERWRRHGDPLGGRRAYPFPENLLRRLSFDPDGCVRYVGSDDTRGYRAVRRNGRSVKAHVAMYELMVGPVPEGLELDHLCHGADPSCDGGSSCPHRSCVNPGHLEPVTPAENTRRGLSGERERRRTHCPQGHPYEGENLYVAPGGGRHCRTCGLATHRRYRERLRLVPIEEATDGD